MAKHTKKSDHPDATETIRLADVITFLNVYNEIINTSESNISTLLYDKKDQLGSPSTVLGQLKRIGRYLFGPVEGEDLGRLFSKESGVLVPTEAGHQVHRHFLILKDVYARMKVDILGGIQNKLPVIRIGATQSIGLSLLSAVFSDWARSFGKLSHQPLTQLGVEIANSPELITRLNSGLLDLVISYGIESTPPAFEPGTDVTFRSLGYVSRRVLQRIRCQPRLECCCQ